MNEEKIKQELHLLLHDATKKEQVKADYARLTEILQVDGNASVKAVDIILSELS